MESISSLLPHIVNGISLGLLFALMALGFMLIVGVMELINLSHGSLFALGAYLALTIIDPDPEWFGAAGAWFSQLDLSVRYVFAILFAPLLVACVGMIIELCMRRTYGKAPEYGLLLTFGVAMVIEETIRIVWGSGEQNLPTPAGISGAFLFNDLIYSTYRLYAAGFAMGAIILVWAFLEKTPFGAIIKAGAHDGEMVRALGVNLSRLRLLVFGFGASLAGLAGIIMVPIWGLRPHVGVDVVIPAFLIIVLGGIGSFWGAVIAGVLVGLAVGVTGAYATEWSIMSMYILLILVVTFRSRGLMGKKSALEA